MCGIIGVFDNAKAEEMAALGISYINYRGIDGRSFSNGKKSDGKNAIGHCLHAVVSKIKQPLTGNGILAANCEIYNWKELCSKYTIEARNDAETLLKLLDKYGIKIIDELDGDYACAYWNEDELYIFRDLIGVKPVWFSNNYCFAFCSEKKALEKLGFTNIEELNPRKILKYNIKNKSITFIERDFFILQENKETYEEIKEKVKSYLTNAVIKRIPEAKLGLLFSGGVDSSTIALILKQHKIKFKCYTCVLEYNNFKEAKDLEIIKVNIEEVKNALPEIIKLIESSNVVKVGVAIPFYFACKKAREDNVKVILSGLGSEEVFAGYQRHKETKDVNKECYSGIMHIYERDLYRDDVITMYNNIELRVPFLDKKLIEYSLTIPEKYKINDNDKAVLREVAFELGLSKEIAYRKKIAAQYGSNFAKAIEKLAKGYKNKSEYLNQFYRKPNVKLGALFSSGKDSCYAMWIMIKQNYSIECLISIASRNKDSYMFHTPNIEFVKEQSRAMGIPLILRETNGEKEKELEDLKKALAIAKQKYGIQGVVSGALFSNYQRERIEKICDELGLKVFTPLWHKNQEIELKELINEGFEFIISSVAGLGIEWLGKKITLKEVDELVKLSKKNGINVCGEGGEYESFVLNAPLFKSKIKIESAEKIIENENVGKYCIKNVSLIYKTNKSLLEDEDYNYRSNNPMAKTISSHNMINTCASIKHTNHASAYYCEK